MNTGQITGVTTISSDPDSSGGNALLINNTSNQISGNLVKIKRNKWTDALNITKGDTILSGSACNR